MNSNTPITDDAVIYLPVGETIEHCDDGGYVPASISRELETKNRANEARVTDANVQLTNANIQSREANNLLKAYRWSVEQFQDDLSKTKLRLSEAKDQVSKLRRRNNGAVISLLVSAVVLCCSGHPVWGFLTFLAFTFV